jgi:glycosyltransferase involved in cell wall biosynthesis
VPRADRPLVSVVTPVYNGEKTIARCIESVLSQTYSNFEYVIVNNRSTDGTLAIAREFAARDQRVRIHDNADFLSVFDNHNHALALVCDTGKYIKVVAADDWLYPACLEEMVRVAETYPTTAVVSSYGLCGSRVGWDGLPYPSTFLSGRDACRMYLLHDIKAFGNPTTSLLRSSVVRARQPFYKLGNYHADTEAVLELLTEHDFGFVHQVLSYRTGGEESRTTHSLRSLSTHAAENVEELIRFGPAFLTEDELARRLREEMRKYYQFLADGVIRFRGRAWWEYHRTRMQAIGRPINRGRLAGYLLAAAADRVLNPKRTVEGMARTVARRFAGAAH